MSSFFLWNYLFTWSRKRWCLIHKISEESTMINIRSHMGLRIWVWKTTTFFTWIRIQLTKLHRTPSTKPPKFIPSTATLTTKHRWTFCPKPITAKPNQYMHNPKPISTYPNQSKTPQKRDENGKTRMKLIERD